MKQREQDREGAAISAPSDPDRDERLRQPPFREMAKLAALTLVRLNEIRLLRREQVHLEQGVVVFPNPDGWPWSRHYVSHVHENPIVLDGSGRMW